MNTSFSFSPSWPDVARIIGHRGAAGLAPENTLAGIKKAADLGIGWVEFDVTLSQDHQPLLLHDSTLNRTTNGSGLVCERNWEYLRSLNAGWKSDKEKQEPIPSLQEALFLLKRYSLGANIEIKPSSGKETETTSKIVEALGTLPYLVQTSRFVLSSFRFESLGAAKKIAPHIPRALLYNVLEKDWLSTARQLEVSAIHCAEGTINGKQKVEQIVAEGYNVRCYTVNQASRAKQLFSWGVHSIFTDYPDRFTSLPSEGG